MIMKDTHKLARTIAQIRTEDENAKRPTTKISGSVTWKIEVGEAASRFDNGCRSRVSWAWKPRHGGRKSGEN
jgi:hypothetical protein